MKPSAPTIAGPATCQRRSPVASECDPTMTIATAAPTYGTAETSATVADDAVPSPWTICGSQKLTP